MPRNRPMRKVAANPTQIPSVNGAIPQKPDAGQRESVTHSLAGDSHRHWAAVRVRLQMGFSSDCIAWQQKPAGSDDAYTVWRASASAGIKKFIGVLEVYKNGLGEGV
jgi:hypothetical protein